jgi:hypothetical protein
MTKLNCIIRLCVSALVVGTLGGCAETAEDSVGNSQEDSQDVATQTAAIQINGWFRLRNYKNPKICAGVARGTPTAGTGIIPWTCDGSANQQWRNGDLILPIPGYDIPPLGYGQLVNNVVTDPTRLMCLDGWIDDKGTQAVIWPCGQDAFQAWNLQFMFSANLNTEVGTKNLQCFRIQYGANTQNQVLAVERGDVRNDGGKVIHWPDLQPRATSPSQVISPDQVWCVDKT